MTGNTRLAAAFFWLIVSCLCWAANYIIARLMMTQTHLTPSSVTFWRYLAAALIMFCAGMTTLGWRRFFAIRRSDWLPMLGQGAVMSLVSLMLLWCERFNSAMDAAMVDAVIPVMIMLGSVFIGQKIRMLQLIGMMISLSGCLFVIRVVTPDGLRLSQLHWSDLLILGSAGSWALYVLWGRGTVRRVPSLVYTGWTLLSCTAAVGIYSLLDGQMLSLPRNSEGWWLLVWMILFPTIGAFWAWNQASGVLALPIQNISQYLIPVSAVVMAHFMLSESLSAFQILGIFLITCGVAMDPAISARLRRRCGRFLHHVRSGRK